MDPVRSVKGMNDVLPAEIAAWHLVEDRFRATVERYGYREIRCPVVEPTNLFVRSIGEATDIVEKEMYTFVDKGEQSLTLRPEGTASIVRAYVQHAGWSDAPVARWYYLGPMYRRERPQKGRYRQFYQLGVEVFGDPGPLVDAEMIDMAVELVRGLGIERVAVAVNSLGSADTRARYRDALVAMLQPHRAALCPDCQRRLDQNPLRILDCKIPHDKAIAEGIPSILDSLCEDCRTHFDGVRRRLDALGVPYTLDPKLVRGLDYYTRTAFEVHDLGRGAQSALGGGGRYDGLISDVGGPAVPGVGFSAGLERILLALEEQGKIPRTEPATVFVARAGGSDVEAEALQLVREVRGSFSAVFDFDSEKSLGAQLKQADKVGASVAVILGEDELKGEQVTLKNLKTGAQERIARADLAGHLARHFTTMETAR